MADSLTEKIYLIQESEKCYRMLFEKAGDAIFFYDAEDKDKFSIVAANQAAANMYDYSVDELLRLSVTDLHVSDITKKKHGFFRHMTEGKWINQGITCRKKDGTLFSAEISGGSLVCEGHKYVVTFERDVTERKETEKALQRAEQLEIVGDLTAGFAHELKNCLAGVEAAVEVLLSELVISDDHRSILLRMSQEIRQVELLTKDLLNFARPSRPQFSLVDINSILNSAMVFSLENLSPPPEKKGTINVVKKLDAGLPKTVADPMQLQQVFVNLLINSVDSMPDGGSLTVETSYEPARKLIQVSISDTGTGIRREYMDKIFEPFFTTKGRGTGLGLPITKRLVEQNNGAISVDNNPNGGAIFKVSLPLKRLEEGDHYEI
jgi:two-component system sensor histidine kinase AtoS